MSWTEAHLAIVLAVAATLVVVVIVLQQRRTPQSAAAWLMFTLLVPYLAIPVFLSLGFRKRQGRLTSIRFQATGATTVPDSRIAGLFFHSRLPAVSATNRVRFIEDGQACWREVLDIMSSARQTLDVTYYLIADDPVGRAFVEALTDRVRDGLRVRLIIDRLGGFRRPSAQLADFRRAGGTLRNFSPFLQRPANGHLNLRNHRKMIIADGTRVLSGGRNIGGEYLGPSPDPDRWTDLSFVLTGPAVQGFADLFQSDWAATGPSEEQAPPRAEEDDGGTASVQLVPSGPDMTDDPLHDGLVAAIHCAKTRIWLATPYFLPTDYLHHAMTTAARRGVDVRILLPERSNQKIADIARGGYLRSLQDAGCTVLRFQPGMMHAKACVIDDAACTGSANFDVRSMLLNFELMLFLYDRQSVDVISEWFMRLESQCREGVATANLPRRVIEGVFRLGAPIL